jgi:hypothetical protein
VGNLLGEDESELDDSEYTCDTKRDLRIEF